MSHAAGGSSMNGSSPTPTGEVFDVSSAAGVIALLRRVHVAALPIEVKNQLRDAVFSLQNSSLTTNHTAVQELFSEHGIVIELADSEDTTASSHESVTTESETTDTSTRRTSQSAFGRPAPRFNQMTPTPQPAKAHPTQHSAAQAAVQEDRQIDDVEVKLPVKEHNEEVAESTQSAMTQEASDATTTSPKATTAADTKMGTPDSTERIKEIKHNINGLVGNPVNLIDMDASVGREYMNALLDAMKKVNTGVAAGDMERAMERLEVAYEAARTVVSANGGVTAVEEEPAVKLDSQPTPQPTPTTDEAPEVSPQVAPTDAASTASSSNSQPADSQSTAAVQPTSQGRPVDTTATEADPVSAEEVPTVAKASTTPTTPQPAPTLSKTTASAKAPAQPLTSVGAASPVSTEPSQISASQLIPQSTPQEKAVPAQNTGFTAVAKEKQLKQLMHEQDATLQKQQEQQAAVDAADPLMAQDVTTGLEQLLSEWKLFKSSGIFGTGPSGVDHPLYKKLAPLTMAAIMTGRFDESTPEIKQGITEYMSGWRYEEGIVYEPGETFEHYLRRVIRHILDERKDAAVDKKA